MKLAKDGFPIVTAHRNIPGARAGKLILIEKTKKQGKHNYWLCKCDCGNVTEVRDDNLSAGARGKKAEPDLVDV